MSDDIVIIETPALPARRASLDRNPAAVYLARLAPGSRRAQLHALDTIAALLRPSTTAASLPWHELDYQHVQALRTALTERYAPATVNRMLAALRGTLKEAWRLGLISAEQLQRCGDVERATGKRLPKGRAIARAEMRALFAACPDSALGVRDRAILALLYSAGLRRAELVGLDLRDDNAADSEITVRAGKGNKDRVVPLAPFAREALDRFLERRGRHPGALFPRTAGADRYVPASRLSPQAVLYIVQRAATAAGVEHISPHDFRRTMISDQLDAGTDIVTVQNLAGHANVTTTARYDRRGRRAMREAAGRLTVE